MRNVDRNEALDAFRVVWGDNMGVRAYHVLSDTMKPTIYPGEFAGVVPSQKYDGEGIYLLHDQHDTGLWRCQHIGHGQVRCWQDNPVYDYVMVLSMMDFEDRVLGRVIAFVGHVDRDRTVRPRNRP